MTISSVDESAAAALLQARNSGERIASLPPLCGSIDVEAALRIQQRVGVLLGDSIAGWKCGLPPGDGRILAAPVYESMVQSAGLCAVRPGTTELAVEPEVAFEMKNELPPRSRPYLEVEIEEAIGSARLVLERIDSRYIRPGELPFPAILADGLFNDGLILGPRIGCSVSDIPAELALRLNFGRAAQNIAGRHPDGGPLYPLYWLANFLRTHGLGLLPGQIITTGSYAGVIHVPVSRLLGFRFGSLGTLTVEFCPK